MTISFHGILSVWHKTCIHTLTNMWTASSYDKDNLTGIAYSNIMGSSSLVGRFYLPFLSLISLFHSLLLLVESFPDLQLCSQINMRFFSLVAALMPVLSTIQAAHFDIPEVDAAVSRVRHDYSAYFNHQPALGSSNTTKKGSGVKPQAAGQAYWYEQIAHQGISAFGASGYKVYRNVKDYGARGKCY